MLAKEPVTIKQANAEFAKAARKVKQAERSVSAARKRVKRARGGPAKRRAATLLKRARQQLTDARLQLTDAKQQLADAKLGAVTLKRAEAGVTSAARRVKQAERRVSAARKRVKRARGGPAKRRAAILLKRTRQQLTKAKQQLAQAKRLLAAKQQQLNWAIVGVKAGASLGAIRVNSRAGYALAQGLSQRAWRTWVDTTHTAQAKNGVPIGAGNFGFVRSARTDGAAIGDLDRDGIPDALDIDRNGNLILNNLDASPSGLSARDAQTGGCGPGNIYCQPVATQIRLCLWVSGSVRC